jgi:arabinogalactan endo-1,4-beta-galactosidase
VVEGAAFYRRDVLPLMAPMPENRGTGVFYWTGGSTGFLGQLLFIDDSAPPIVLGDQLTSLP